MILKGNVWKVGDNIDTDTILPGQYLSLSNPKELGVHCMEGVEVGWASKINPGDILIAGKNFGCGSSREHAAVALKECGISCVVAESFGAIFFRNAINVGLPVIELAGITDIFLDGDKAIINVDDGIIENQTDGQKSLPFSPLPTIIMDILTSGGLMEYIGVNAK